jgi:hypothetical protein
MLTYVVDPVYAACGALRIKEANGLGELVWRRRGWTGSLGNRFGQRRCVGNNGRHLFCH